jgi:hypothetical protein
MLLRSKNTIPAWTARLALTLTLCAALWLGSAAPARAQGMEVVFKDGLWGAGIGALIGTAQVLLIDDPEEELHRIPTAMAIGAILGVAFGLLEVSGAFASYDVEANRLVIAPPMPRLEIAEGRRLVRLDLFEAKF